MIKGTYVNAIDFGAVGDDLTDSTAALQAAIDYAYDNRMALFIPSGTYKITAPLKVWASASDEETSEYQSVIFGEGRQLTEIKKYGNTTANDGGTNNIDCVFIILNSYVKDGNTITDYYDATQTLSLFVDMSNMKLSWNGIYTDPNRVYCGIWSNGYSYCKFDNLWFADLRYAMITTVWNYLSSYTNMNINRAETGISFYTPIGGNSTMSFENIHFVGCDVLGMYVKGGGVISNCAADGGLGTPFYFKEATFTMIQGYHEAPVAGCTVFADASKIDVLQGNFEMLRNNTATQFQAINNSQINVMDTTVAFANRSGFPSTSDSTLSSADVSSNVRFTNCNIDLFKYTTRQNIINSYWDKKVLINQNYINTVAYNKCIVYVPGSVSSGNYPVLTVTPNGTTGNLDLTNLGTPVWAQSAIALTEPIDVSEYSRIKITVNMSHTLNSNTSTAGIGLSKTLVADGNIGVGAADPSDLATYAYSESWYDGTNIVMQADVSALYGSFYVYVWLGENSPSAYTVNIEELCLLK